MADLDDADPPPALPVDTATTLAILRSTIRAIERDPSPFLGMDEENLRSCLLVALNGSFAGRATAETHNARGKTDILVRSADRNVFIGECKVYNGPASLVDAIGQLLRYTTWSDRDLGLIVFVRSGEFSTAIAALQEAAETSEYVTTIEAVDDQKRGAELRLRARRPDDPGHDVHISALLVHVPIPKGHRRKKPEDALRLDDAMEAMLDIQRALPEDAGVRSTLTLDPAARRDEPVGGWRVLVTRATPDGTVGVEVVPETPEAMHEHGPEGALIAPDDATARRLHESLRRTQRDLVPTDLTGVGIRIDRIAGVLRDSADRLQRTDPSHLSGMYGPRGLWQCKVSLKTDRGALQIPIAFAEVDPYQGWHATVRGTIFDLALLMSVRSDERDTQFAWKLTASDSPSRERLAALDFLYVYSGRGTMHITSIEPNLGNGTFNIEGFTLDDDTLFERELLTNVVAVEDHVGATVEIPDRLERSWLETVFKAGLALRSGAMLEYLERVVAVLDPSEAVPEPGDVRPFVVPKDVRFEIGDLSVDLGRAQGLLMARVVSVRRERGDRVLVELVPADDAARRVELILPSAIDPDVVSPEVILVGRDNQQILTMDDWLAHAPPVGGDKQWVDGYSAKEQAKAWLRDGPPAVPAEILDALLDAGVDDLESLTAYPEHETPLDAFGRGRKGNRNHDLLGIGKRTNGETVVIGIEAKACEGFDGVVASRASVPSPSKKPHRANLMARALFGRDVCDVDTGAVLDAELATHGYQLWTAAVGTLIEAAKHEAQLAVLIVHQFMPNPDRSIPAGDRRHWPTKLAANDKALNTFVKALTTTGEATSQATEFVPAGITLRIRKALAPLAMPEPCAAGR